MQTIFVGVMKADTGNEDIRLAMSVRTASADGRILRSFLRISVTDPDVLPMRMNQ